jgi:hypothetical protein
LLGSTGTLSGTLSGSGTLTLGTGETLTLGANFNDSGLNIVLNGGTLKLNGTNDTFGSLTVNSSSIVDFDNPAASIFDVSGITIGTGQTLTVNNWANVVDYFYSNTNPGSAVSQITFSGYPGSVTKWNTYQDGPDNENQVIPAPEPAAYGAVFVGASLAGLILVRRRRLAAVRAA